VLEPESFEQDLSPFLSLCVSNWFLQIAPNTAVLNPSNPMICDGTIKSSSVQLSCGTGAPTPPLEPSTAAAAASSSSPSQRGAAADASNGNGNDNDDNGGQPSCLSVTPMDFDTTKGYYERHGWKVGLSGCPAAGTPPASSFVFHMSDAGELRVGGGSSDTCLSSVPLNGPQLWTKPLETGSDAGEQFPLQSNHNATAAYLHHRLNLMQP
jgi:hypothetical protein